MRRSWLCVVFGFIAIAPAQVHAAPTFLRISVPAGALKTRSDAPPVTVAFVGADGAVITAETNTVNLELGPNRYGARLTGILRQQARQGVATFAGLTLDKAGDGYSLIAWSPGVPDAQSAGFAFTLAPDPHEVVGYGCGTGGASGLALIGLAALLFGRRRRGVACAALALTLHVAAGARAEKISPAQVEAARTLNKNGIAALQANRLDEAIALFEQARKSYDAPSVIYNLAEAHRRAGHFDQALELYHAYLAAVPDPSRRADLSDFELLERQQAAKAAPGSRPAETAGASEAEPEPAAPRRRFLHAPGIYLGPAWFPGDERVAVEALLQIGIAGGFRLSAGGALSPRPAVRVAVERELYGDEDFSIGVALRGLAASFPVRQVTGGGGGFSLRVPMGAYADFATGAFLEYYATKGEHFLSPILTAGIGLHL